MPGKKHVAGVGSKEQRMYEHIKQSATASVRKKWPHLLYSSTIARKGIRQASEHAGCQILHWQPSCLILRDAIRQLAAGLARCQG